MTCPDCNGTGRTLANFVRRENGGCTANVRGNCSTCNGTGELDALRMEWHAAGQTLRTERLARGQSLRAEAKRRGLAPSVLSEMEQGRIEPILDRDTDDCPYSHGSIPADCAMMGCTCQCFDCRQRKGIALREGKR